ncbi:MAG TPA: 16S rRNA (adenine(1518)-N(6)/adenine(1519)-N(6))-dimethyltransferase RsmA [Dehalococcoidia bacterium]|nr:16S rRNA (adenine(1518)-N(6)/adenine(1519)-N(6))-dimethyltransferase RsmA [Dehalococcoidia bacterium]
MITAETVRQFGFKPKKRLGQHFLVAEEVVERILFAAELGPEDIIVEVGPGLGMLTRKLAEHANKVIAVELDSKLVSMLRKRLSSLSNVKIIHGDILKVAPRQLLEDVIASKAKQAQLAPSYKVVANLPYYITSPVLRHFLEAQLQPSMMVVMVQKEVGEAIAATSGKMSLLSVRTQFYSKPSIISYVPAKGFYPPPKVDSLVLRLDVYSKPPIEVSDFAGFFDIVIRGFSSPRKQLRNSLAQSLGMPPSEVALLLEKAKIQATRRAETLSLEEWKRLWKLFAPFKK